MCVNLVRVVFVHMNVFNGGFIDLASNGSGVIRFRQKALARAAPLSHAHARHSLVLLLHSGGGGYT